MLVNFVLISSALIAGLLLVKVIISFVAAGLRGSAVSAF
jgi:hypothetical protein